jgi:dual specificity phosphatase 12
MSDENKEFWNIRSEIQEVIPRLYITNYFAAKNKDKLIEKHIKFVVVCDPRLSMPHTDIVTYLRYSIDDNPGQDLLNTIGHVLKWIDNAREAEHNVLVHCAAGVSRSGSIVTAYIMYKQKIPFEEALSLAKIARPFIDPNVGFQEQLKRFAGEFEYDIDKLPSKK